MKKILLNVPVMYTCTHRELTRDDFIREINKDEPYIFIKVYEKDEVVYYKATSGKSGNTLRDIQMFARGVEMAGFKVERQVYEW